SDKTWLDYPDLPTPEEIMSRDPTLPLENHPNTAYATHKAYFEVQWRLLRHEGIEPLRRAVQEFRENPTMNDTVETYIYDEVRCCSINVIRLGVFGRFKFSMFRSAGFIDWTRTERLIPGCCVALSPADDMFDSSCFPAIVVGRNCSDPTGRMTPVIDLEFEDAETLARVANPNLDLVMVEARSNYYEAVRHVMVGLKQAAGESSPLIKYLTDDSTEVGLPATISSSSRIDVSPLVSAGQKVSIPARGELSKDLSYVTGLDDSQLIALQRMLATDLAVVQGPPGTGKTFTSIAALKVLLDIQTRQDPPIIVTAQKNDTVDDILSRLIKSGIKVARLGGQSKDDEIGQSSLLALRNKVFKLTKNQLIRQLDNKRAQLRMCMAQCFPSEKPWLPGGRYGNKRIGYDFLEETNASHIRRTKITYRGVGLSRGAQVHHRREMDHEAARRMAEAELMAHADLWDIASHKRSHVYEYLVEKLVSATQSQIREVINAIKLLIRELKLERLIEDFTTIRCLGPRVVGCTTTGLTKYRGLLAALGPRVMIVEEAAESREANIAAGLFPSLQQLILVGDHLQLKPHADVRELGLPAFNLNVSLFQRLVERGVDYSTLLVQRRMAPSIRKVLDVWYPGLQDHSRVHQLPSVPGMGEARAIWLDHQEADSMNRDVSRLNKYEATLIVVFAHYLVLNGTEPSKITVLSFYSGQKMLIQNIMSELPGLADKGVEVQTVDGYQGKENDVILLSVTRSSRDRQNPSVGFLGMLNRVIVALSRARLLNVVFGNMAHLLSSARAENIWAKVEEGMRGVRSTFLPMVCVSHNREFALHGGPMTCEAASTIGCGEACGMVLSCGHACSIKCH
ncbi:hypothetical protein SODALDRAFT_245579, partial [Sodiomyces alkalinus F11]